MHFSYLWRPSHLRCNLGRTSCAQLHRGRKGRSVPAASILPVLKYRSGTLKSCHQLKNIFQAYSRFSISYLRTNYRLDLLNALYLLSPHVSRILPWLHATKWSDCLLNSSADRQLGKAIPMPVAVQIRITLSNVVATVRISSQSIIGYHVV